MSALADLEASARRLVETAEGMSRELSDTRRLLRQRDEQLNDALDRVHELETRLRERDELIEEMRTVTRRKAL